MCEIVFLDFFPSCFVVINNKKSSSTVEKRRVVWDATCLTRHTEREKQKEKRPTSCHFGWLWGINTKKSQDKKRIAMAVLTVAFCHNFSINIISLFILLVRNEKKSTFLVQRSMPRLLSLLLNFIILQINPCEFIPFA